MIPVSLLSMQFFQNLHDQNFHSDIYTLPTAQRMSHLHNHLVKYHGSPSHRLTSLEDSLACVLSFANTAKLDLQKELGRLDMVAYDFQDIKDHYHPDRLDDLMQIQLSRMAKALEGLDHIESINYSQVFGRCAAEMLVILIQMYCRDSNRDVFVISWLKRLDEIKRKNPFFPMVHKTLLDQNPIYKSFNRIITLGS